MVIMTAGFIFRKVNFLSVPVVSYVPNAAARMHCCLLPLFPTPVSVPPISMQSLLLMKRRLPGQTVYGDSNPCLDENNVKSVIRRYSRFWKQRLISEKISLTGLADLIMGCFAHYSMQFMQIRNTRNQLFLYPT